MRPANHHPLLPAICASILCMLLVSCNRQEARYHIGFSQCVGGAWREKVNMEMLSAQHLYNNVVDVDIKNADNISERQIAQIDSFVSAGVDILVVAPNDYKSVAPAIARARRRGIPVVLFDRKADTNNYTAYIGGDNVAAGRAMANYALSLVGENRQGRRGTILELTGGVKSSPALDRHRGFMQVMERNRRADYRFMDTDWSSEMTYRVMQSYLKTHPAPDVVFCHSDLAALSARQAAKDLGEAGKIRFLGIDGLPGKDEGIENVAKGLLAGTYIYPTNGEQIVKLCLDILQGKPYRHDNLMQSVIVTPDNASLLLQTGREMEQRNRDLLTLQDKIESLFGQYHTQRMLVIISSVAIFLLIVALALIFRTVIIMRHINRKEKRLNREQTLFYTNARHQLRTPLTLIAGPLSELSVLIFSVPTGVLMNKIGRKRTVMLSLIVTIVSLLLPIFTENFAVILIAFSLLGIGNALMQTSLNPLVSSLVKGHLASTLTFGQFVKAIASFMAPIIAAWGAAHTIPDLGLGWKVLFPIYMVLGILASLLLAGTPIDEESNDAETPAEQKSIGRDYIDTFRLLGIPYVLLCFFGIMCHVGIDVGVNTTAPKLLHQYAGQDLQDAAFAGSLYFLFRTIGCLTGTVFLRVLKTRTFFIISVCLMALSMALMASASAAGDTETAKWMLYCGIACVGYGNSNVFSMVFSQAMLYLPEKKNAVSGLMIMGLFGGTIFPLFMGFASDAVKSQIGAVAVMAVGVVYLISFINKIKY